MVGGGFASGERFGGRFDRYRTPGPKSGTLSKTRGGAGKRHITNGLRKGQTPPRWWNMGGEVRKKIIAWDVAPGQEYFKELFRVSRNQIIWGGNYFELPPTRCFLIWRKTNVSQDFSMAMAEYAWTSFSLNAKVFDFPANGQPDRFHPTQKPVQLYTWILANYANKGDKILDTHAGSASSLVACEKMGFEYVGFEIDETYYKLAQERINEERAQLSIWQLP